MKLGDILSVVRNNISADVQILVAQDWLCNPPMRVLVADIHELYTDWMGDAEMCPENGEQILALTFVIHGRTYAVDSKDLSEMTFDQLMELYKGGLPSVPVLEDLRKD